jgi:hypothetical protein
MGENTRPQPFLQLPFPLSSKAKAPCGPVYTVDKPEYDDRKVYQPNYIPREIKLPKINFPVFTGEHPKCGETNVRNILPCTIFLCMCGFLLQPLTLEVMLSYGYKPTRHNMLSVVGLNSV